MFSVFILISFHQFSLALSLDLSISMSSWNYNEMNAVENDILEHRKHYVRCAPLCSDMHSYSNITNIVEFISFSSLFTQNSINVFSWASQPLHPSLTNISFYLSLIVKLNDFHFTHLMWLLVIVVDRAYKLALQMKNWSSSSRSSRRPTKTKYNNKYICIIQTKQNRISFSTSWNCLESHWTALQTFLNVLN